MATILAPKAILFFFFLFLFSLSSSSLQTSLTNLTLGFSMEIIHRDSPLSPLYDPNATTFDRWNAAYRRSISRLYRLQSLITSESEEEPPPGPPIDTGTPILEGTGEYLVSFRLGSSGSIVHALIDTGSTLVWTQCIPCFPCYQQQDPIFQPAQSTTFKTVPCVSPACKVLSPRSRCAFQACIYWIQYAGRQYSDGTLSSDDFTFSSSSGDNVTLRSLIFGCAHNSSGRYPEDMGGIVGLGLGGLSFVTQLGPQIGWRFSYCLYPFRDGEQRNRDLLLFGKEAKLIGQGTPIAVPKETTKFYYLTLQDISVGSERLHIPPGTFQRDPKTRAGGFVVDSGTTLTLLNRTAHKMLVAKLKKVIDLQLDRIHWSLCYNGTSQDLRTPKVPVITFHFLGLDVDVQPWNSFLEVFPGVLCLTMKPSSRGSIFGNLSQRDLNIGFDAYEGMVYIAPAKCASA